MRAVLIAVLGSLLLIVGGIAGVGGLGLLITDPCASKYRLSLQPADSVSDLPEQTVSYGELSDVQKTAVDAALKNRSRLIFRNREPLAELAGKVIKMNDTRYVAHLETIKCRDLHDDLAIAGFTVAVVGISQIGFALIIHRYS